jgi:hypothetical protein
MKRATACCLLASALVASLALTACADSDDTGGAPPTATSADDSTDFCVAILAYQAAFNELPSDPRESSRAELELPYMALQGALSRLEDTAPLEVESHVRIAAATYEAFITAFAAVDYDYSRLINDAGARPSVEALGSGEMSLALAEIERYFTQECG